MGCQGPQIYRNGSLSSAIKYLYISQDNPGTLQPSYPDFIIHRTRNSRINEGSNWYKIQKTH